MIVNVFSTSITDASVHPSWLRRPRRSVALVALAVLFFANVFALRVQAADLAGFSTNYTSSRRQKLQRLAPTSSFETLVVTHERNLQWRARRRKSNKSSSSKSGKRFKNFNRPRSPESTGKVSKAFPLIGKSSKKKSSKSSASISSISSTDASSRSSTSKSSKSSTSASSKSSKSESSTSSTSKSSKRSSKSSTSATSEDDNPAPTSNESPSPFLSPPDETPAPGSTPAPIDTPAPAGTSPGDPPTPVPEPLTPQPVTFAPFDDGPGNGECQVANEDIDCGADIACGRETFPDGDFICCPSGDALLTSSGPICSNQADGASCPANNICAGDCSGFCETGPCVEGVCQAMLRDVSETCDDNEDEDCANNACGRTMFPDGAFICCPSGETISVSGSGQVCTDQADGASCPANNLCAGGCELLCESESCVGGECQAMPGGVSDTCDDNENGDCANNACGRATFPDGAFICCPSGESISVSGSGQVCTDQADGASCPANNLCAGSCELLCESESCVGGECQAMPGGVSDTCDANENGDCTNNACGRATFPDGAFICCPSGETISVSGSGQVCTDQADGASCPANNLCAGGCESLCGSESCVAGTCQASGDPIPSFLRLEPFADTTIRLDVEFRTQSFGSDVTMLVQSGSNGNDDIPDGFALLAFDMTDVPSSDDLSGFLVEALLQLEHATNSETRDAATLNIVRLPSTPLVIESLTGDTFVPTGGIDGPSFQVAPADTTIEIDITDLIFNTPIEQDQLFLMIENRGPEQEVGDRFFTREGFTPAQLTFAFTRI